MSINKPCFENLYSRCCDIIKSSSNKNIKKKQLKLDNAYQILCKTEDGELQEFYSIVLELKVYEYLINNNVNLIVADDSREGPDFESDFGYIECISVTKGKKGTESRNYVDKMLSGSINRHKAEIPRISSAIKDKKDKYLKYIKSKTIDIKKPKIILIGTSIFVNEFHSSLCVKDFMHVLYAIGNEYIMFDKKKKKFVDTQNRHYHNYDKLGKKSNKIKLEFDYFYQDEYKDISAVILVCNQIFEEINKSNFVIFINHNANCPIDKTQISQFNYFSLINENNDGFAVYEWNKKTTY